MCCIHAQKGSAADRSRSNVVRVFQGDGAFACRTDGRKAFRNWLKTQKSPGSQQTTLRGGWITETRMAGQLMALYPAGYRGNDTHGNRHEGELPAVGALEPLPNVSKISDPRAIHPSTASLAIEDAGEAAKHSIRLRPIRLAAYMALSAAVISVWLSATVSLRAARPIDRVVAGSVLPRKTSSRVQVCFEISVIRR